MAMSSSKVRHPANVMKPGSARYFRSSRPITIIYYHSDVIRGLAAAAAFRQTRDYVIILQYNKKGDFRWL